MKNTRRNPAFSLVEMVMVIVIIAVLAGLATPRISRAMVKYRAGRAARVVVSDLQRARAHALAEAKAVAIHFDLADSTIRIPSLPHPDHPALRYRNQLSAEPYRATIIEADFDSSPSVTFNGLGEPDSGGRVVVQCGDQQQTIILHPSSAEAEVQ
ncbi:MAG: GspH/FimT family pseudopilin [Phycisphaerae bacterium]